MSKELKYKVARDSIPHELLERIERDVKDILNTIEKKYANSYKKAKA